MDDLETSSYIQPKIDTHIRVDVPTSVLAQFPGLQQTKKYFPILPLVWSLPAFPFYIFQMQTFCRCPDSLQQVWNMERGPVCLVLMDHFVKISSFRYVLPACWLSCSLLVSVFFFPSLCFLFVDDCWLVIAFSNRYHYLLSLWIVLQLFHSYADFRWDRGNFSWRCFVLNELWPFCCVCCCLIRMFIDPCF